MAKRDTSFSRTKTGMTKKNALEAGMTKTEKLKPDQSATSTLPPETFAKFAATTKVPGKPPGSGVLAWRGQRRRHKGCLGLLRDAD